MKIGFFGTPTFAADILRDLLAASGLEVVFAVTNPDVAVGRSGEPKPSPVKIVASEAGIPVLTPEKVRGNAEFFEEIRSFAADYFVVAAYGKILPNEVLEAPKKLSVNVHGSVLPKYRGASPVQSVLLEGETETGVTIMAMSEGMDEGDTLGVLPIPIERADTAATLFAKFSSVSGPFLVSVLREHFAGKVVPVPQDHSKATYCKKISKEDALADWSLPAETLFNRFRGYSPWPGLHTFFREKRLSIEKCETLPEASCPAVPPGTVFLDSDGRPCVRTPDGGLILEVVKLE